MTQAETDKTNTWRGIDQGARLRAGGNSGLNIPLAGTRDKSGPFAFLGTYAYLWSSSALDTSAQKRLLNAGVATVGLDSSGKDFGFSIRCLAN